MNNEINEHRLWIAISEKFPEYSVKARSALYHSLLEQFRKATRLELTSYQKS